MDRTHHKLDDKVRLACDIVVLVLFLPIVHPFCCELFYDLLAEVDGYF